MKKTKSLVITSLLFSAMVLNPSTVQRLVVQAADGVGSEVTAPEEPAPTPGQETPENNVRVTINYISDDSDDKTVFEEKTVDVKKDSTTLDKEQVTAPKYYNLIPVKDGKYKIEDGKVNVHVSYNSNEFRKSTTVKYMIEGTNDDKTIPFKYINNLESSLREILVSDVVKEAKIQNGYELSNKNDNKVTIANGIIVLIVKPTNSQNPTPAPNPGTPNPGTSKPTPKPTTKPSATDKKTYKTTVNFIDQATKKKVNTTNISGKNGQVVSFTIPKGYELAKGESKSVKIDKNKSTVEVKVIKNAAGKVTAFKGLISTKNPSVLYSKDGKRIANRGLAANSDWVTDKKLVLNGETYYGVSTNEFVKASDVFEFQAGFSIIGTSRGISKHLYNSKGEMVSNRALAPNTYWRTDKKALINNQVAYRVSTNEWVLESDLV